MGTRQHDYPTNFSSTYSAVGKNWVRTNITSIPPISQPRTAAPEQETIWDNDLVVIFSSIVLFICFCMCTKSRIPDERYRRGEQIRESARRALQEKNARFEDPELRQQLIDQSLVKKFVISCDEDGNLALGDDSNLEAGEIEHVDNDEETDGACVICLEPFRVGELVAWSKNSEGETECLHVWHDCCIQEWLRNVKHDDCPSCRSVILFGNDEDSAETNLGESNQGVFRIIDGLISRATRRASKSLSTGIAFKNSVEIPEELLKQPISFRKVFSSGAAEYLKSKKDTENESLLIGTKRQQRRHTLSSEFFDEKCHSHEH